MLSLKIEAEQIAGLEKKYSTATQRVKDLAPIQKNLDDLQREELKLRFLSSPRTQVGGVVYGDVYWNRLSEAYLNQVPRRRKGQVMIDTGRLQRDATTPGTGNTSTVNGFNYEFAVNTPYAQQQDQMRQLLFWSESLLDKTSAAIVNYVTTGEVRDWNVNWHQAKSGRSLLVVAWVQKKR